MFKPFRELLILIMCGSVVEAILLDKLETNEGSAMTTFERIMQKRNISIKGRDRKIENWSLENLIEVALEEK